MGIIKKQSIQSTLYTYLGVGLGFLNSAILFPRLLEEEHLGMLYYLNSFTAIFAGLCSLGVPLIVIKLFPKLRDEKGSHHGLFSFVLLMTLLGIILGVAIYFSLGDWLITDKSNIRDFSPFLIGFLVLLVFRVVSRNFDSYIRMLMNTVLGSFLENFLLKVIIFVSLAVCWWIKDYNFVILFYIYVLALALPGIVSVVYIIIKGEANLRLNEFRATTINMVNEIWSLAGFGLLATLGGIIVLEIDRVMIGNMIGPSEVAIYSTSFFFGLFCSIPARGLKRISTVILAEAWEKNDLQKVKDVYYKSSLNLFLFGVYLFLGVWLNIDYVLLLLPEVYSSGKMVILIIGIAQLIDLITGVNNEIITSSKYYKYTTYFISILIAVSVISNYLLIPIYGIDGAAVASLLSIVLFNLLKVTFLFRKLNYQPINFKFFLIILIGTLAYYGISIILPTFDNIYIAILITGSVLTLIYWVPVYLLKISSDVNETIDKFINKK